MSTEAALLENFPSIVSQLRRETSSLRITHSYSSIISDMLCCCILRSFFFIFRLFGTTNRENGSKQLSHDFDIMGGMDACCGSMISQFRQVVVWGIHCASRPHAGFAHTYMLSLTFLAKTVGGKLNVC